MLGIKPVKIISEDESTDVHIPPAPQSSEEEVNLPSAPSLCNDEEIEEYKTDDSNFNIEGEAYEEELDDSCKSNRLFGAVNRQQQEPAVTTPRKIPIIYVAMGVALLKYLF